MADETTPPDWTSLLGEDTVADMQAAASSLLSAETFSASSERDALGRVLTAGKVGGTSGSPPAISIQNRIAIEEMQDTLVHEGTHALDILEGLLPPSRSTATAHQVIAGEFKAWHAGAEFAHANAHKGTVHYHHGMSSPFDQMSAILDSYKEGQGFSFRIARLIILDTLASWDRK